ncbi:MAG: GntR family transcriptional regulator, partial [Hyphomicrobiaceae bacterium]|nr:GntR family transcriptional regulator [Hyphomicrobiaceae bacterium]
MDKPQTTLARDAYRAIKSAIRDGIYRPGDRLREEEVAERFGISRTPVR